MAVPNGAGIPPAKLIVGFPDLINVLEVNVNGISIKSRFDASGTMPSWIAIKAPDQVYIADENSDLIRLYRYDPFSSPQSPMFFFKGAMAGSKGVVHLEFNKDKTRLVASSYALGQVDIWDISIPFSPRKIKQVKLHSYSINKSGEHRAHQSVVDPSGRYFAVNDLGGDSIHILDSKDDMWELIHTTQDAGNGPRHGAWLTAPWSTDELPTHYVVVSEMGNRMLLFMIQWLEFGGISLKRVQDVSTYGDGHQPANPQTAAAGALVVTGDSRHVYVSNRLTGFPEDAISHFCFEQDPLSSFGMSLVWKDEIASGGICPRMCSLSFDERILWCTNQQGKFAVVAYWRNPKDGSLRQEPAGVCLMDRPTSDRKRGPLFIMQIV